MLEHTTYYLVWFIKFDNLNFVFEIRDFELVKRGRKISHYKIKSYFYSCPLGCGRENFPIGSRRLI